MSTQDSTPSLENWQVAHEASKQYKQGSAAANRAFFDKIAPTMDAFASAHSKPGKLSQTHCAEKLLGYSEVTGDYSDQEDLESSEDEAAEDRADSSTSKPKFATGIKFDPERTRILDYACGSGLISMALAAYAKEVVGVDASPGMVDTFNKKMRDHGIPEEEMQAFEGDLLGEEVDGKEALDDERFWGFDVVTVGFAFHHFPHPLPAAAQRLAARLRHGGHLVLFDFYGWDSGDTSNCHGAHTITSHGFSEEAIKKILWDAGLANVGVVDLGKGATVRFKKGEIHHGHDHMHAPGHMHGHGHAHQQPVLDQGKAKGKGDAKEDGKEEVEAEYFERRVFMAVAMRPFVMIE